MNYQEFFNIKHKVAELLSVNLDYDFEIVAKEGVYASLSNGKAVIGGGEKTDFYRALMLFSLEIQAGKPQFEIIEQRHFDTLGLSLDVSRNGVIKVPKIKEIIDCMALLGFNCLSLYMEDVYDLPGYPHFGYRRGKYSHEELREMDDYAHNMGIEVVPSIQTLGHLEQYLRYSEAEELRENSGVLLCGAEKTYAFIEAMIKTMRKCFKSRKMIINCDEATGIGISRMMEEHQYVRPYDIVMRHIERVQEICRKYEFRPSVHGDLFFGHLGTGNYDPHFHPERKDVDQIPDIDIIYWDYYHTATEDYQTFIKGLYQLGKGLSFMGGIWIWAGQLPNVDFTFRTMNPALECCLKNNVRDIWAATFGDDGNETNMAFVLPQLLIFSEHCFKGEAYTEEWVYDLSKRLFKLDMKAFRSVSDYHYPWVNGLSKADYPYPNYMGKKIFYTDVLYNMVGTYDFSDVLPKHKAALQQIKDAGKDTPWESYFDYAGKIFETTIGKMQLIPALKEAYKAEDEKTLQRIAREDIPVLIQKYETLMSLHEEQWLNMYKPFGWEELNVRYMGLIGRLQYAQRAIERYLKHEISSIDEMEYDFIEETYNVYSHGKNVAFYRNLKSTGL